MHAAAAAWVEATAAAGQAILISSIVLCETVWALRSTYHLNNQQLGEEIRQLLSSDYFQLESDEEAAAGLHALAHGADFADGVIASRNLALGCQVSGTMDRTAASLPGFELIE